MHAYIPFLMGDLGLLSTSVAVAAVFLLVFAPLRSSKSECGRVEVAEDLKMLSLLSLFRTIVFPILCKGERLIRVAVGAAAGALSVVRERRKSLMLFLKG